MGLKLRAGGPSAPSLPQVDEAEIRRAVGVLWDEELPHQIQILPGAANKRLAAKEVDAIVAFFRNYNESVGLHWSLNPCKADTPKSIEAVHIARRRWLMVDVDAIGEDVGCSATDDEVELTQDTAQRVQEYLSELGWPTPVVIDSGNGTHLLYRIDLPNDDDSRKLIHGVLNRLGSLYNTPGVKIDPVNCNANRLGKMPGTWARKGKETPERRHRMARLRYVPDTVEVVPVELLREFIEEEEKPPEPSPDAPPPRPRSRKSEQELGDAVRRIFRSQVDLVASCPRRSRNRNNTLNRAVFVVSGLLHYGYFQREQIEEAFEDAAHQCYLAQDDGIDTVRGTIRSGLKGVEKPWYVTLSNGPRVRIGKPDTKPSSNGDGKADQDDENDETGRWRIVRDDEILAEGGVDDIPESDEGWGNRGVRTFQMYTLDGLINAEFPDPNWVVPGLLSEGLNILAGKPKLGKSMMSLNLAITLAAGGQALGEIKTVPSDVLYLSLEDKDRRVQARALKMLRNLGVAGAGKRLTVTTTWPRMEDGGLEMLEFWRRECERPALVIIDVWTKFRPEYRQGSQYDQDYRHMSLVKNWVDKRGMCALVLMHCKKEASSDVLEEVTGTMGLTGVADGTIVLSKSRNSNEARIFTTGRDFEEQELALEFDPETLVWTSLGKADDYLRGKLQIKIINYLKSLGGSMSAFTKDIAEHCEAHVESVRKVLHRMHDKRLVRKVGHAWAYPHDPSGATDPDGDEESW